MHHIWLIKIFIRKIVDVTKWQTIHLQALTWFNIHDDGVDKTALSVKSASCLLPYTTPYDVKINLKDKPEDEEVGVAYNSVT